MMDESRAHAETKSLSPEGRRAPSGGPLLEVRDLVKHFPIRRGVFGRIRGWVRAVDGVSFDVGRGETLGLVGESGCGKTTVGRTLLRLIEPTGGSVRFEDEEVSTLEPWELRELRCRMQAIFQDPYSSLNPRMTIERIVGEGLVIHDLVSGSELNDHVAKLLERVGLSPEHMRRYPHEFSGGQRQRIGIARALAVEPSFIVCDEPVSALDVSIQAQIVNLLEDLQEELGLSYLFIAHDLAVVEHISHRVAVMYLGKIVEYASREALYASPLHPYTQALLSAVPVPDPGRERERIILSGDVPSAASPPPGCRFHTRCSRTVPRCRVDEPPLGEIEPDHRAACWLVLPEGTEPANAEIAPERDPEA